MFGINSQNGVGQNRTIGLNVCRRIRLGGLHRVEDLQELVGDKVHEHEVDRGVICDLRRKRGNKIRCIIVRERSVQGVITYARAGILSDITQSKVPRPTSLEAAPISFVHIFQPFAIDVLDVPSCVQSAFDVPPLVRADMIEGR